MRKLSKRKNGNGERAELRGKELSKPMETGDSPPDPMCSRTSSAKYKRKRVHHVNRRFVRRWLGNKIADFIEDAFDDPRGDDVCAALDDEGDAIRQARLNSWMYRKVASKHCSVTVTSGRIIFNA